VLCVLDRMSKGSCLCGEIRYELDGSPIILFHCHCSRCRKAHGTFATFLRARDRDFAWTAGEELLTTFDSINDNHRYFCSKCGSLMPARDHSQDRVSIPAGSLDDDPQIRPLVHLYASFKPPWYEIRDEVPEFDELAPREFYLEAFRRRDA